MRYSYKKIKYIKTIENYSENYQTLTLPIVSGKSYDNIDRCYTDR
jgi:hypothetical protein